MNHPVMNHRVPTARCISLEKGFTLLEMLVVIAILGILTGAAIFQARSLSDPMQNQSAQVLGFIKQIRARAVASTAAYLMYPTSATHFAVARGASCPVTMPASPATLVPGSFTADPRSFELREGVRFVTLGWAECVTQRGLFTNASNIQLVDSEGKTKTVAVFLGGATRLQ